MSDQGLVYHRPSTDRIYMTQRGAKRLYSREEKARAKFRLAADQLAIVRGYPSGDFYTRTLPEALFSFLEGFDPKAVEKAFEAWLDLHCERAKVRTAPLSDAPGGAP